jgi:hypothetical protein
MGRAVCTCLSQDFFDQTAAILDPKGALGDLRGLLRMAEAADDRYGQLNANIWLGAGLFRAL